MTTSYECPYCYVLSNKIIRCGKRSYICKNCNTVFPKEVIDNIYAYSLNKDVTKGIEWDV